jgi:purine nucleoside phosphorylase
MTNWTLGIIGGSGLYQVPGIEGGRWQGIASPWGEPSDQVFRGRLHGIDVVFLPRPRARPPPRSEPAELPRQYRHPEACRLH